MLPPELIQFAKEMGVDLSSKSTRAERYKPLNKLRKNRDKKKLRKRRMVNASRRKNR